MPTKLKVAGLRLQWHITYECDQRCRHCYVFDSAGHEPDPLYNLDWKASKRILNDLVTTANRWSTYPKLAITGGDPLLHPDFFRLLEYARKVGIAPIVVMGNPFHLDRSTAKKLSQYINGYQISLDGMQQTHDRLRKKGSYAESVRALELLRDTGIPTIMAFTLSRINHLDLPEAMRLAAELNIDSFGFDLLTPTGRGKALEQQLLSPLEIKETFDKVHSLENQLAANGKNKTQWAHTPSLWKLWLYERNELDTKLLEQANARKEFLGGCLIGEPCLTLQANGNVVPCPRIPISLGKMPENTISQILAGSTLLNKFRNGKNFEKCRTCPLVYVCRGCPAHAYSLTGDAFAADPYCWKDAEEGLTSIKHPESGNVNQGLSIARVFKTTRRRFTLKEKQTLVHRDFWLRNLIERDEQPHICHALFDSLFPQRASLFNLSSASLEEKLPAKSIPTLRVSQSNSEWFSEVPAAPYYLLIDGRKGITDFRDILEQIRTNAQKGSLLGIGLYLPAKNSTTDIVNLLERYNIELMLDFDCQHTALEHPNMRSFGLDTGIKKLIQRMVALYNGRLTANISGVSTKYADFASLFQGEGFRSIHFSDVQGLMYKAELSRILTLLSHEFDHHSFPDVTPITLTIRMFHFLQNQALDSTSSILHDIRIERNNPTTTFFEQMFAFYLAMGQKDPEYLRTICQTPRGLLQRSQELLSAISTLNPIFESG